jgi:hypothetical protein
MDAARRPQFLADQSHSANDFDAFYGVVEPIEKSLGGQRFFGGLAPIYRFGFKRCKAKKI